MLLLIINGLRRFEALCFVPVSDCRRSVICPAGENVKKLCRNRGHDTAGYGMG